MMLSPSRLGVGQAGRTQLLLVVLLASLLTACSARLEWRELRSPDGYSVLLPGRAQTVQRELEFEGRKLPVSMTSTGVGPTMFAVGVVQLPPESASDPALRGRVIAHFRDALVRNIGGTMATRGPATLAGAAVLDGEAVEARGRTAEGRPAKLVARFFIVDDRLFEVIALGAEDALDALALETFFTSFRLTPKEAR